MGWTRNWIGKCEHSQARAHVCSVTACLGVRSARAEHVLCAYYVLCTMHTSIWNRVPDSGSLKMYMRTRTQPKPERRRTRMQTRTQRLPSTRVPGPMHTYHIVPFPFLSKSKPVRSRKSDADHAALADTLLSLLLVQPTAFPQGRSPRAVLAVTVVRLGMGPGRAEGPVTRYVAWIPACMLVLTCCVATATLSLSASSSPPAGVLDYFLFRRYLDPDCDPETDTGDLKVSTQYTSMH